MPSKWKVTFFTFAFLFISAGVKAQAGQPTDHPGDYIPGPSNAPQHLTRHEKMIIAGSVCRPAIEELRTIISESAISCTGVLTGMGDAEDSPMDLVIFVHGDIFDGSDDAETLRHGILFVLGKYLKNDPEVSVVFFASQNRLYVVGAQTIIDQHDRILAGNENLKAAWADIERFTNVYETREVGNGCPAAASDEETPPATEVKMTLVDPDYEGKWTFLKYDQCIAEIKGVLSGRLSDHAPPSELPTSPAHAATTFRGHTLGESWQTFQRTDSGLCELNKLNSDGCSKAAAGEEAMLFDRNKEDHADVAFHFNHGRFDWALAHINGPTFTDFSFLEKTYGSPSHKIMYPEKGNAAEVWRFSDGGEVLATEIPNSSGGFLIGISVRQASGVN